MGATGQGTEVLPAHWVVTLLCDFNCRLKPGMSMADHVSPLGAKLPLRAGRPIVSPSAAKMTALLRGCDLFTLNDRRNGPSYTWRRTRTDCTVDQRSTIDFTVTSREDFDNGSSVQYEEEYRAGTDYVLLGADIPASTTSRRPSKRAIFKYHRAPIISDWEFREA